VKHSIATGWFDRMLLLFRSILGDMAKFSFKRIVGKTEGKTEGNTLCVVCIARSTWNDFFKCEVTSEIYVMVTYILKY
jgi:hypothetical protein